jgi:DNA-binding CsgD family transcriptional regulator
MHNIQAPRALEIHTHRQFDPGAADQHVAMQLVNGALIVRNLELTDELASQQVLLQALQTLVVSAVIAPRATRRPLMPTPLPDPTDAQVAALTARQVEVLRFVVAGYPSKRIAVALGISQRTVENHRATIMTKTGTTSLPALTLFALRAGVTVPADSATGSGWPSATPA